MITIKLVLMLLAVIVLFLAAAGVAAPRINLLALGLALWALATIITV
jgi:hypothetical protein